MLLADRNNSAPITFMTVTVNPRDFTVTGTLPKIQIHITTHLFWDTLEFKWFSVLLKLSSTEVTLPTLVTYPSWTIRVRGITDSNELISYIMFLSGVT